jgi:hypothetical protein
MQLAVNIGSDEEFDDNDAPIRFPSSDEDANSEEVADNDEDANSEEVADNDEDANSEEVADNDEDANSEEVADNDEDASDMNLLFESFTAWAIWCAPIHVRPFVGPLDPSREDVTMMMSPKKKLRRTRVAHNATSKSERIEEVTEELGLGLVRIASSYIQSEVFNFITRDITTRMQRAAQVKTSQQPSLGRCQKTISTTSTTRWRLQMEITRMRSSRRSLSATTSRHCTKLINSMTTS